MLRPLLLLLAFLAFAARAHATVRGRGSGSSIVVTACSRAPGYTDLRGNADGCNGVTIYGLTLAAPASTSSYQLPNWTTSLITDGQANVLGSYLPNYNVAGGDFGDGYNYLYGGPSGYPNASQTATNVSISGTTLTIGGTVTENGSGSLGVHYGQGVVGAGITGSCVVQSGSGTVWKVFGAGCPTSLAAETVTFAGLDDPLNPSSGHSLPLNGTSNCTIGQSGALYTLDCTHTTSADLHMAGWDLSLHGGMDVLVQNLTGSFYNQFNHFSIDTNNAVNNTNVIRVNGAANIYNTNNQYSGNCYQGPYSTTAFIDDGLGGGSYDGNPGNTLTVPSVTAAGEPGWSYFGVGTVIGNGPINPSHAIAGGVQITAIVSGSGQAGVYTVNGSAAAIPVAAGYPISGVNGTGCQNTAFFSTATGVAGGGELLSAFEVFDHPPSRPYSDAVTGSFHMFALMEIGGSVDSCCGAQHFEIREGVWGSTSCSGSFCTIPDTSYEYITYVQPQNQQGGTAPIYLSTGQNSSTVYATIDVLAGLFIINSQAGLPIGSSVLVNGYNNTAGTVRYDNIRTYPRGADNCFGNTGFTATFSNIVDLVDGSAITGYTNPGVCPGSQ